MGDINSTYLEHLNLDENNLAILQDYSIIINKWIADKQHQLVKTPPLNRGGDDIDAFIMPYFRIAINSFLNTIESNLNKEKNQSILETILSEALPWNE